MLNTYRINRTCIVLTANEESLRKRIARYLGDKRTDNLKDAIQKLDRMQQCIEVLRKEISDEIREGEKA